jgi:chondroitin-sulfate-ABC endolyase/exolyase
MNHTVAAIHRREDWMVFVRGQRSPYVSGENYQGSTAPMSRFLNFGLMEIVSAGSPPNILESSLGVFPKGTEAGWDFNYHPGTTARVLPNDALTSHFPIDERFTAETFALGTSLDGNGVFGMKLREDLPGVPDPRRIGPVRYWMGEKKYHDLISHARVDPHFRARKSVFFFDDRIVCLGSGIRSRDPEAPVRTTLFQHMLTPAQKSARPFPDTRLIAAGDAGILVDRNGNGYYVAPGNNSCTYTRAHRDLPYVFKWNPLDPDEEKEINENSGDTELAFLDHGGAPKGSDYEYCVLIRADDERMKGFALAMSNPERRFYDVLQRDDTAHIVYDRNSATTGYVIFEPGALLTDHRSLITSSSRPCVAMTRIAADGILRLSVCDPEIGGEGVQVELTLAGPWRVDDSAAAAAEITGQHTRLMVPCRDALPATLTLRPVKL